MTVRVVRSTSWRMYINLPFLIHCSSSLVNYGESYAASEYWSLLHISEECVGMEHFENSLEFMPKL